MCEPVSVSLGTQVRRLRSAVASLEDLDKYQGSVLLHPGARADGPIAPQIAAGGQRLLRQDAVYAASIFTLGYVAHNRSMAAWLGMQVLLAECVGGGLNI